MKADVRIVRDEICACHSKFALQESSSPARPLQKGNSNNLSYSDYTVGVLLGLFIFPHTKWRCKSPQNHMYEGLHLPTRIRPAQLSTTLPGPAGPKPVAARPTATEPLRPVSSQRSSAAPLPVFGSTDCLPPLRSAPCDARVCRCRVPVSLAFPQQGLRKSVSLLCAWSYLQQLTSTLESVLSGPTTSVVGGLAEGRTAREPETSRGTLVSGSPKSGWQLEMDGGGTGLAVLMIVCASVVWTVVMSELVKKLFCNKDGN